MNYKNDHIRNWRIAITKFGTDSPLPVNAFDYQYNRRCSFSHFMPQTVRDVKFTPVSKLEHPDILCVQKYHICNFDDNVKPCLSPDAEIIIILHLSGPSVKFQISCCVFWQFNT